MASTSHVFGSQLLINRAVHFETKSRDIYLFQSQTEGSRNYYEQIHDFINLTKIKKAKLLIPNQDGPLKEIYKKCNRHDVFDLLTDENTFKTKEKTILKNIKTQVNILDKIKCLLILVPEKIFAKSIQKIDKQEPCITILSKKHTEFTSKNGYFESQLYDFCDQSEQIKIEEKPEENLITKIVSLFCNRKALKLVFSAGLAAIITAILIYKHKENDSKYTRQIKISLQK